MNKIRKKRKPDTLQVNFVEAVVGKKGNLSIQPVKYPFKPSSGQASDHVPATNNNLPASSTTACFPPECEVVSNDFHSINRNHTLRKEKSTEAWANVRPQIIPNMIAAFGFPTRDVLCVMCKRQPASVWCPDCGPIAYFCLVIGILLCLYVLYVYFSSGMCNADA